MFIWFSRLCWFNIIIMSNWPPPPATDKGMGMESVDVIVGFLRFPERLGYVVLLIEVNTIKSPGCPQLVQERDIAGGLPDGGLLLDGHDSLRPLPCKCRTRVGLPSA